MSVVELDDIRIGNRLPLVLIGGLNVLESADQALECAGHLAEVCRRLGMPFVFKASFDKANRSAIDSYRGPGLERGLQMLSQVRRQSGVAMVTDVHRPEQAAPAAEVCQLLQLPAFLARQTDLVAALATTGAPINIKKPQFMAPSQVRHILDKFRALGNDRLLICERGTCLGYDNLVVDMLGLELMRRAGGDAPVVLDATHALQCRAPGAASSGGRRDQLPTLARAGVAAGLAALFVEFHPQPDQARCDGPSAWPLGRAEPLLEQLVELDRLVKSQEPIAAGQQAEQEQGG